SAGAGAYELATRFTARALPSCGAPQKLDPNTGFIQRLGASPCRGPNGQPVDYYEFTLPADGTIAGVLTSSDLDGYLALTDAAGTFLRSDDDSLGYGDPLFAQFLPAGTYRLAARATQNSFGGLYRVDVKFLAGSRPPGCNSAATLSAGAPVKASITFAGCQYSDDTFADIYQFKLTDATAIDLQLTSADFDAFLVLIDAKG